MLCFIDLLKYEVSVLASCCRLLTTRWFWSSFGNIRERSWPRASGISCKVPRAIRNSEHIFLRILRLIEWRNHSFPEKNNPLLNRPTLKFLNDVLMRNCLHWSIVSLFLFGFANSVRIVLASKGNKCFIDNWNEVLPGIFTERAILRFVCPPFHPNTKNLTWPASCCSYRLANVAYTLSFPGLFKNLNSNETYLFKKFILIWNTLSSLMHILKFFFVCSLKA
jgi:hypothetical protein